MDPKLLWLVLLIILTLVQIVLLLVKRNGNKKRHVPGNPGYGERIGILEKGQELIEGRLTRIEGKLNGWIKQ